MQTIKEKRKLGNELRKNNHLNPEQLQIVFGGLLGDSSIHPRENGACRIKLAHCPDQLPYLNFKKKILEPFIIQDKPTFEAPGKQSFKNAKGAYSYSTIVHQDFTDIYPMFYKKISGKIQRKISMKTLLRIGPLGLLIWYLDDGTLYHSEKKSSTMMRICSNDYSLSDHLIFKKWLWKNFRVPAVIMYDSTHFCYNLRFNKDGRNAMLDVFEPYLNIIPDCMQYKLVRF